MPPGYIQTGFSFTFSALMMPYCFHIYVHFFSLLDCGNFHIQATAMSNAIVFSQKQTFCKHLKITQKPCWQNHFSTDEAVLWRPSNSVFSSLCPTFSPRPFPTALSEPAQFCSTAPANKHVSKGPRFSSLHEIYGPKMEGYVLWCDCFIICRMYLVDFSLSLFFFSFGNGLSDFCDDYVKGLFGYPILVILIYLINIWTILNKFPQYMSSFCLSLSVSL